MTELAILPAQSSGRVSPSTLLRAISIIAVLAFGGPCFLGAAIPPGFDEPKVIDSLYYPTAVAFSPDGRVFVAEKGGRVLAYDSLADPDPTVFADLRPQVLNHIDRGLIGLALAPNFPADPWVYVLYTADMSVDQTFNQNNDYPPKWGDEDPFSDEDSCDVTLQGCIAAGRLSRIRDVNGVGGAEQVLVQDWFQQFSSHSVGDLEFAADGTLYVSSGEGAAFHTADLGNEGTSGNPSGDPLPDDPTNQGGAFRAQDLETDGDATGLSGAVLRVVPSTGAGAAGNPLISSGDLNERRIVAYGLRNPFRLAVRPNGELWIADVGWNSREEIDRLASPGSQLVNFGWPCWEGDMRATEESENLPFASTPICQRLYDPGSGHGLPAQPHVPHTPPVASYSRADDLPSCGSVGNSSSLGGLVFHPGGGDYPAAYSGRLFVAEYIRGCILMLVDVVGNDGVPETFQAFLSGTGGRPVDLAIGPGGNLFYVDHSANGSIRRLRYGGNEPPTAVIGLAPGSASTGSPPHTVTFDAGPSDDDAGDNLSYAWDLDGNGSYETVNIVEPTRQFGLGSHTVRLRVTDGGGLQDVAMRDIVVQNGALFGDDFEGGNFSSWDAVSY